MGGAALVLIGLSLILIGEPSILGSDSPSNQSLTAIGSIMIPLGLGILLIGMLRRREAMRRVIFVEAPTRGLRTETLAYIQANSSLGMRDIARPEPAPLNQSEASNVMVRMQTLKSLLEKGLISEEDFREKKNEILSRL